TPYYLPVGQPELLEYVRRMAAALPLPMLLYNIPSLTKVAFEPDTIRRAMEIEGIIGLKDSSGDMLYFHRVRRLVERCAHWTLLVGPEEFLAESVLLGGHGCIGGGANLHPRLLVNLYEAAVEGDLDLVSALHDQLLQMGQIYRVAQHGAAVVKGLKCALSCL